MKTKNIDTEELEPKRENGFPGGYADMIDREEAEEIPECIATHYERIQRIKYWAYVTIHYEFCYFLRNNDSFWRKSEYACDRQEEIFRLLEPDEANEAIENVIMEYGAEQDADDWKAFRQNYEELERRRG